MENEVDGSANGDVGEQTEEFRQDRGKILWEIEREERREGERKWVNKKRNSNVWMRVLVCDKQSEPVVHTHGMMRGLSPALDTRT